MAIGSTITPVGISTDEHYRHEQSEAAEEWIVRHNLGKRPAVQIFDTENIQVLAYSEHIDENTLIVAFSEPCRGTVECN